jgi:aryl-alcohol dehydrogenase-like predicted oxidoreductase
LLPACERLDLGFVPYFPLASGLLTGKYRRGQDAPPGTRLAGRSHVATDEQFDVLEGLERYADERDVSLLQVAFGGLLAQPVVSSVIAGATKPEQIRANASAATWSPGQDDLSALEAVV